MARITVQSIVPDALKNFDLLPDSAHVRQPVVEALFGCSGSTVWRMVKRKNLPAPRKLSERISAWNVGELRKKLWPGGIAPVP
jgi:predicted DNA-binding transcriptional regulator AlpA